MTVTASYIPDPTQTDQVALARAAALGIGVAPRQIPPVYQLAVTQTPGVIAQYGVIVYIHDDGTLTPTSVANLLAPLNTQQTADQTAAANIATITTRVQANLNTLETFIANNPTGAVLTAAQTNVLARVLAGLCRLLLNEANALGGS